MYFTLYLDFHIKVHICCVCGVNYVHSYNCMDLTCSQLARCVFQVHGGLCPSFIVWPNLIERNEL